MHAPCNKVYCAITSTSRTPMTTSPPRLRRDTGLRTLSEQMPRFMRLIHGLKAQHTAEGGRDRAALVLLFPLHRVGPLRQSELAELVHADPSTVSRHVTLLVERGLVRRVADESDGRASRLVLTDRSEERRVGKECRSRWSPYD